MLVVLVWPASVDWLLVGLPVAAGVGVLARMQWAYYKKHL